MLVVSQILLRQPPVVMMHGIMMNAGQMNDMGDVFREQYPGIYVKSCEVGNGFDSSLIMRLRQQIDELSFCINSDPQLQDGFIGVGFSQGGLLMMGYLELHNHLRYPMLRLVGLAAPLAGYFCGIQSECGEVGLLPPILNEIAAELIYTTFVQGLVAGAAYWRDPYNLDLYTEGCDVLPELENIRDFDAQRKKNFLSVDKMVLFGSHNDGVISPWQSAWFQTWAPNDDSTLLAMEERPEYQQDLFGLRTLNEQGRLFKFESGQKHTDNSANVTFIREMVAPWIAMDL